MKLRNHSIDLVKLYLALVIAVGHTPFPASFPSFSSGYVVCLFFLLSGYFLVRSADSGKYADPWQYTLNRVKKLYPYYITAFVITYLQVYWGSPLRELVLEFFRCLPELLMLQSVGIFPGGLNYPLWQLSTLVVVSHILFALVRWNRQCALNVICPVVSLCAFRYYISVHGEATLPASPFVTVTLLRAAAGLCLGMFLHDPIQLVLRRLKESTWKGTPWAVSALSLFLLPVIWTNRMSYGILLPFVGLVICLLYPGGIWARLFRSRHWGWLDKLSLGIYVNHAFVVRLFERHPAIYESIPVPPDLVYLAVLIPYCLAMMALVDAAVGLLKRSTLEKEVVC